jgi:uncharacterized protein
VTDHVYSDGDVDTNCSGNRSLESMIEARFSRRQTMFGGVAALTTATLGSSLLTACGDDDGSDGSTGSGPLQVTAGSSGATSSGRMVMLTGSTSFDVPTVGFEQVSGPPVTLTNAGTAAASFMAPSVAAATPLVFRFTGTDLAGRASTAETTVTVSPAQLGFTAVAKNLNDTVTVPEGYTVTVLYRLGDPIAAGVPAYANNGTDSNFAQRAGDHHDALYWYGLSATGTGRDDASSTRGLLVINHENITQIYLHPNGPTSTGGVRPEGEALKEIEAHGLSVVEVRREGSSGAWSYVQASALNRRITPNTEMTINGPVRGSALVRTAFSPDGTRGRGTINNCANGITPWGTNLTCEENWAGYLRRPTATDNPRRSAKEVAGFARYGVGSSTGNYGWSTVRAADSANTTFRRWDATVDPNASGATGDFRNEPHQFGWVVEVDPYDPAAAPRKRTALGRMAHEGAWPGLFVAGRRPAWYMGDDSRGEYLYKFVSNAPWAAADAQSASRLAIGDKYLDSGTLYVARFNEDGTGVWVPLVFGQGNLTATNASFAFADQADVLVNTRIAADVSGATPMDRPEWTAVNPRNGEVYLTLTNNSNRRPDGTTPQTRTNASNPRAYSDPRTTGGATNGNANGHIIRLRENGDNTEALAFTWDIYLFGAGADLNRQNINLSGLDGTNDFSSPDGLWFARPSNASGLVNPVLWIETDDGAYTDVTNCMLLAAMPGQVGDGGARTISNTVGAASNTQATIVGREATPATLRRFLVGPKECEITGIDSTPDGRSIFVNIQHPGEDARDPNQPSSNWPGNQQGITGPSRPRSATIVITKNDGGVVGL